MGTLPPPEICHRHPDRETRLKCGRCDRPVCVDCYRQTSVGGRCRDCADQPRRRGPLLQSVTRSGPSAAVVIIVVNVAIWLTTFLSPEVQQRAFQQFAHIPAEVVEGEWWRMGTAAFLHSTGTFLHIAFNMYVLWVLGPNLEDSAGRRAFLGLYAGAALLGGTAYQLFAGSNLAIGASGAIFGLFGAYMALAYAARETAAGQSGLRQIGLLLAINLALPIIVPNIAWQAHLGGLVAGAVIAGLWTTQPLRGRNRENARAAVGLAVAVVAVLPVAL